MPYSNIVFIKLFLELFDEDDRFLYHLSEKQQLLYIKLLYLAGRQKNKIAKNPLLIIQKINYQGTTQDLLGDIQQIKKIFKKFQETKYYYTFINFEGLHNKRQIRASQGRPKELQRVIPDKDKDKDKEKERNKEKEKEKELNTLSSAGAEDSLFEEKPKQKIPSSGQGGEQREKPTTPSPKDLAVRSLIDFFFEEVKSIRGFYPEISGGKEGALLKRRLTKYREEDLRRLVRWFVKSSEADRLSCSLSVCLSASVINKWQAEEKKNAWQY